MSRLPHARPRWQARLERIGYVLSIVILLALIFIAWSSVDPELASRQLP